MTPNLHDFSTKLHLLSCTFYSHTISVTCFVVRILKRPLGVAYGAIAALKVVLPEYQMFAPEFSMGINLPVLFFSVGVALVSFFLY
jgi:hypothetical protein